MNIKQLVRRELMENDMTTGNNCDSCYQKGRMEAEAQFKQSLNRILKSLGVSSLNSDATNPASNNTAQSGFYT